MTFASGVVFTGVGNPTQPARLHAQAPSPDFPVDAGTKSAVIDAALRALNEAYVFPDVAKAMESAIRARQARKEYDAVTTCT